ncbi:MAG TPA: SDR family oxidoreductase [Acidimicrobiales bacterium]|nr:SDR family oxidoreductase [Acidimicrobiales bacterium]
MPGKRVAVVTGASSGIGRRLAADLRAGGDTVVGVARRAEGEVDRPCDVSDTDAYRSLLADVEREHGRIDVLLNVAGVDEPVEVVGSGEGGADLGVFRRVMEVNYFAVVAGTLAVLPGMVGRGSGIIVNVSSDSVRAPVAGISAYAGSKGAVSAFTESVAHEVHGTGVRVHVLYPGWVPTPMGLSGVDRGMPEPPRISRRTEEQVARLVLERMGRDAVELNAVKVAVLSPIARAFLPRLYRRSLQGRSVPAGNG